MLNCELLEGRTNPSPVGAMPEDPTGLPAIVRVDGTETVTSNSDLETVPLSPLEQIQEQVYRNFLDAVVEVRSPSSMVLAVDTVNRNVQTAGATVGGSVSYTTETEPSADCEIVLTKPGDKFSPNATPSFWVAVNMTGVTECDLYVRVQGVSEGSEYDWTVAMTVEANEQGYALVVTPPAAPMPVGVYVVTVSTGPLDGEHSILIEVVND